MINIIQRKKEKELITHGTTRTNLGHISEGGSLESDRFTKCDRLTHISPYQRFV